MDGNVGGYLGYGLGAERDLRRIWTLASTRRSVRWTVAVVSDRVSVQTFDIDHKTSLGGEHKSKSIRMHRTACLTPIIPALVLRVIYSAKRSE